MTASLTALALSLDARFGLCLSCHLLILLQCHNLYPGSSNQSTNARVCLLSDARSLPSSAWPDSSAPRSLAAKPRARGRVARALTAMY
jgi:hypothetical protein